MNRPFKARLAACCHKYVAEEVEKQLQAGVPPDQVSVDLSLANLKPRMTDWVAEVLASIAAEPNMLLRCVQPSQTGALRPLVDDCAE